MDVLKESQHLNGTTDHTTNGVADGKVSNGTNVNGTANGTTHCEINGTTNGTVNGSTSCNGSANGSASKPTNGTTNNRTTKHTSDEVQSTSRLLVWTAADEKTLRSLLQAYEEYLSKSQPAQGGSNSLEVLEQLAFTLAARRSLMLWRTFAVLDAAPARAPRHGIEAQAVWAGLPVAAAIPTRALADPGLAFVFTGQGAQYVDMALSLVRYPVFRDALRQVDDVLRSLGCAWSVFGKCILSVPTAC